MMQATTNKNQRRSVVLGRLIQNGYCIAATYSAASPSTVKQRAYQQNGHRGPESQLAEKEKRSAPKCSSSAGVKLARREGKVTSMSTGPSFRAIAIGSRRS